MPSLRRSLHIETFSPGARGREIRDSQKLVLPTDLPVSLPASQPKDAPPATLPSQPILDFIASDESLDRFDEIICASGWHLDSYRRNPVFQNAHQYGDILFTLGKALITEVRSSPLSSPASPRAPVLYQRIQFATDVNPVARVAYGLYKGKFLNAVSVGFIPLRWEDGSKGPHGSSSRGFRRKYLEQELLEVSAVGIPANPNALALGLKAGAIHKSDLQEILALLRTLCHKAPPGVLSPNVLAAARRQASSRPSAPPLTSLPELLLFARQLHGVLRHA